MEVIPQKDYCSVEPKEQAKKSEKKSASNTDNQPIGVVPPEMPNQAVAAEETDKPSKTSPLLFILVMILLTISSGLGYLLVSGQTSILIQLLPIK